jgi:hypothetical protein
MLNEVEKRKGWQSIKRERCVLERATMRGSKLQYKTKERNVLDNHTEGYSAAVVGDKASSSSHRDGRHGGLEIEIGTNDSAKLEHTAEKEGSNPRCQKTQPFSLNRSCKVSMRLEMARRNEGTPRAPVQKWRRRTGFTSDISVTKPSLSGDNF